MFDDEGGRRVLDNEGVLGGGRGCAPMPPSESTSIEACFTSSTPFNSIASVGSTFSPAWYTSSAFSKSPANSASQPPTQHLFRHFCKIAQRTSFATDKACPDWLPAKKDTCKMGGGGAPIPWWAAPCLPYPLPQSGLSDTHLSASCSAWA